MEKNLITKFLKSLLHEWYGLKDLALLWPIFPLFYRNEGKDIWFRRLAFSKSTFRIGEVALVTGLGNCSQTTVSWDGF